jgi:hypothetical protein
MTVIALEAVREKRRSQVPNFWQPEETAELMRLYAVLVDRLGATEHEYGETENNEPQFYALGTGLTQNCVVCVSRISKDSRTWYVIEDGMGGLLAEGYALGTIVTDASERWRSLRSRALLTSICSYVLLMAEAVSEESFAVTLIPSLALA